MARDGRVGRAWEWGSGRHTWAGRLVYWERLAGWNRRHLCLVWCGYTCNNCAIIIKLLRNNYAMWAIFSRIFSEIIICSTYEVEKLTIAIWYCAIIVPIPYRWGGGIVDFRTSAGRKKTNSARVAKPRVRNWFSFVQHECGNPTMTTTNLYGTVIPMFWWNYINNRI